MTTKSFYNNSPTKSSTFSHHPSFHSHRRVRSMPSSELNMLDIFQPLGPSIIDNTALISSTPLNQSRDTTEVLDMIPALGRLLLFFLAIIIIFSSFFV